MDNKNHIWQQVGAVSALVFVLITSYTKSVHAEAPGLDAATAQTIIKANRAHDARITKQKAKDRYTIPPSSGTSVKRIMDIVKKLQKMPMADQKQREFFKQYLNSEIKTAGVRIVDLNDEANKGIIKGKLPTIKQIELDELEKRLRLLRLVKRQLEHTESLDSMELYHKQNVKTKISSDYINEIMVTDSKYNLDRKLVLSSVDNYLAELFIADILNSNQISNSIINMLILEQLQEISQQLATMRVVKG